MRPCLKNSKKQNRPPPKKKKVEEKWNVSSCAEFLILYVRVWKAPMLFKSTRSQYFPQLEKAYVPAGGGHVFHPRTREIEKGGSLSLMSAWSPTRVSGQPGLH